MAKAEKLPLFRGLDTQLDMDTLEATEVESLCMKCHKNGLTKLLLTKIPLFKEVIVSSFNCEHCGESNSEVQSGATIPDNGVKFTLNVSETKSLNRMVVKSNSAIFRIPELDFEIPAGTQKGQVTTVESIMSQAVQNLEESQPYRIETSPEVAKKVGDFISQMRDCLQVKMSFKVVVDDPSGNSFVEGEVGTGDGSLIVEHYKRTKEQDKAVGVVPPADNATDSVIVEQAKKAELEGEDALTTSLLSDDVMCFPGNCSSCQSPVETRMKMVDIPHFKQVVIMATNCEYCGFRTNEVKPGAGIEEHGTRLTLKLTDVRDLTRDILKSDTASLAVPELDFSVESGTLGGCFTTVEGLLVQARDQLKGAQPFTDSLEESKNEKFGKFIEKLDEVIGGKKFVHVVLDDPAGNSFIQNFNAPDPDPELTVEHYERTEEHNEELGLDLMNTESYIS